jgi:hypothetical protein
MSRDTFMFMFVLGSGVLAFWVTMCRPGLAPRSFRSGGLHLAAAVVVGSLLGPVLHAVPGLPSAASVLISLFALALPAITYMLLVGLWLVQLAVGRAYSAGR